MNPVSLRTRALEAVARMQTTGGKNILPPENRIFYNYHIVIKRKFTCESWPTINVSVTEVLPPQENYEPSDELHWKYIERVAAEADPEARARIQSILHPHACGFGWWNI